MRWCWCLLNVAFAAAHWEDDGDFVSARVQTEWVIRDKLKEPITRLGIDVDPQYMCYWMYKLTDQDLVDLSNSGEGEVLLGNVVNAIAPALTRELNFAWGDFDTIRIHRAFYMTRQLTSLPQLASIIWEAPYALFGTGVVLAFVFAVSLWGTIALWSHFSPGEAIVNAIGALMCLAVLQMAQTHLLPSVPEIPLLGKIDAIMLPPHAPTTMILMFTPNAPPAQPKNVILGHIVGSTAAFIALHLAPRELLALFDQASVAAVLAMIFMQVSGFIHAPACAYAFLIVKNKWTGLKPFLAPGLAGCFVLLGASTMYKAVVNAVMLPIPEQKIKKS